MIIQFYCVFVRLYYHPWSRMCCIESIHSIRLSKLAGRVFGSYFCLIGFIPSTNLSGSRVPSRRTNPSSNFRPQNSEWLPADQPRFGWELMLLIASDSTRQAAASHWNSVLLGSDTEWRHSLRNFSYSNELHQNEKWGSTAFEFSLLFL